MKIIRDKDRTPVAKDIETYCNRCKQLLYHVVVSHIDGYVAKVKCITCGSEHKYHSETLKAKSSSKRTAIRKDDSGSGLSGSTDIKRETKIRVSAKVDAGHKLNKEYMDLLEKYKDKPVLEYNMSSQYNLHDIILHKNYEKGIVIKISHKKMDVLFPSGIRIMVCNQNQEASIS